MSNSPDVSRMTVLRHYLTLPSVDIGCYLPHSCNASEESPHGRAQLRLEVMEDDVTHEGIIAGGVCSELEQDG